VNSITISGNLGRKAEVRKTKSGIPVTTLALAHTPREKRDGEWVDGETLWFKVTVWSELPEVIYDKGARVIVSGELAQETYEKDGVTRVNIVIKNATAGIQHTVAKAAGDVSRETSWSQAPIDAEEMPF
jgi:single-strand DNA-binding protein